MKIDVRFRNLDTSEALKGYAVRRSRLHLSRFGQEVSAIVLRIGDVNGPRGGVDKRCQVTVHGPAFGSLTLDQMSDDAYAAVDIAVGRITRSVSQMLERARDMRHAGPSLRRAS